jgi:hypothetical protein
VQYAADADEDLVEMPCVSRPWPSLTQSIRELGGKLSGSVEDAFVSDHGFALGRDQINIAQTEAEDVVEPDAMSDHLGREPMSSIGDGR